MSFAPKNLLPKGILLHTIFYKIQLVRPIYLLNRPKVVLPPRANQIFLRVVNADIIGDNILKNQLAYLGFHKNNRKSVFLGQKLGFIYMGQICAFECLHI